MHTTDYIGEQARFSPPYYCYYYCYYYYYNYFLAALQPTPQLYTLILNPNPCTLLLTRVLLLLSAVGTIYYDIGVQVTFPDIIART